MRVSAKADYAVRAAAELASANGSRLMKAERIADAQHIPIKFLEAILLELKHAGIAKSTRGAEGGYSLARPAADISVADVIRAVDGPLANVRGERPEDAHYSGSAEHLTSVWIAVRAALREVLEQTSLADLVGGTFPQRVRELTGSADAWVSLGRVRGTRETAVVGGPGDD
jgi:Rrf2 family protein